MTAAEVLSKHRYAKAACDGCCKAYGYPDRHAAHQIDALKAAGYAVVELPEQADSDEAGDSARFYARENCNYVSVRWSKDIVVDGNWYLPAEARDVAAALLAAVEFAEVS